jgi:chromate transporter
MAIGYLRAGFVGSVAAWLGFTLPSALLMFAFAMSLARAGQFSAAPWLHGLKLVAVAVVIQAIVNMGRSLCPDWSRRIAALLAGILAIRVTGLHGQLLVMLAGALFGWVMFRQRATSTSAGTLPDLSLTSSRILLAIFAFFLVALPPLAATLSWPWLTAFSGFYQTGALVFGGGHVVLPLLQSQLVASGQLTSDVFLAGYGVAQALPGPLFSIAAFAGALSTAQTLPWAGAVLATVGIFLPGYLLVLGGLPWWSRMCRSSVLAAVMAGVKAAVVGLLLASLQQTLLAGAVHTRLDLAWIALAWLAMQKGRVPPWVVVALAVAPGMWR